MVKIRPYKHTDRYQFEKLVTAHYLELKETPPDFQKIIDTIGFFTSLPQCGKIYIIFYENNPIGYAVIANIWKLKEGKISYKIEELYINKNYKKFKLEVKLIELLIKQEKVHSISIKLDKNCSRKTFRFFNFEKDFGPYFTKVIDEE